MSEPAEQDGPTALARDAGEFIIDVLADTIIGERLAAKEILSRAVAIAVYRGSPG